MPSTIEEIFGALSIAGNLIFQAFTRPRYSRWGATDEEVRRRLPGDDYTTVPQISNTRAITIDAPPAQVWPWLVQLGYGRGGLYSYEKLERLIGCEMHNADRIQPELQDLKIGDTIALDPRIPLPYSVVDLQPEHYLLLMIAVDPSQNQPIDFSQLLPPVYDINTWLFYLEPQDVQKTRLLVRSRHAYPPGFANTLAWKVITDPIHFVMERRLLQGVKQRAEGRI